MKKGVNRMRTSFLAKRWAGLCCAVALTLAAPWAVAAETSLSPTTGLPTDKPYRPVLVQLSNAVAARPVLGLSEADIVYEAIIMTPGHTRYLALFNDEHPETVGAIRSTRRYFCELREAWGCPLVIWGTQFGNDEINVKEFLKHQNVPEGFVFDARGGAGRSSRNFFRLSDRMSSHNSAAALEKIVREEWPADEQGNAYEPRVPELLFAQTPSRGDTPAVSIHIPYEEESFYPHYTFNAEERVYERWYCGEEQYDGQTGRRVAAANVIVQYASLTLFANRRDSPIIKTTGSGPIDAFIDGTHIRGHWVRSDMEDQTTFLDENSEPLVLLPGKTFIQLVPMDFTVRYESEEGTLHEVGAGTPMDRENGAQ